MISGFVVYHCHGNIDFSKIAIITNFSLNLVHRVHHVDSTKESVLKGCLKILSMYRNRNDFFWQDTLSLNLQI